MKLPVVESDNAPSWYAQGLNFTCQQCGNCCTGGPGYVWMSPEEVGKLAAHLELSVDETLKRYCRRVGNRVSLKENRNPAGQYDCVFLVDRKMKDDEGVEHTRRVCGVYPVRPLQCRTWPFWDGNLESQENWNRAAVRCHGMNRGRRFDDKEIERIRTAADWPKRPPTSK